jgi:DNA-binding MarR family transcriptional regulator
VPAGHPLPFDPIAEAERQWKAHGWKRPTAMAAITSVMRAQQLLLAQVEERLRPFDLTFARYEALVLLRFSSRGSLPLGKMGERLQVHPTSMTNVIDRLETQGLVRRMPHPEDRRATLAEITPAGRRLVEKATAALEVDGFDVPGMNATDLRQLIDLLQKLRMGAGDFSRAGSRTTDSRASK